MPTDDTFDNPRRPHEIGTCDRKVSSLRQRTMRRKFMPHSWLPSLNRIDRNGITISTVQPWSKLAVLTSHRPFQLLLGCSLVTCQSNMPPWALDEKPKALRRSSNVSNMTAMWSLLYRLLASRRMSLVTRRSGWVSHRRALT